MSKSTARSIKKTADFGDWLYDNTIGRVVDAGDALGDIAYKFTDGYGVEQELLKNGSRAKYTPKQERWLAQGEYPTLRAINDLFNHAPNNAAQHIASNYTAPFLRDISGYNAIESAIKEHKLQNKLHSNQAQSIELVEKIGDLGRAPLGVSPESLRKAHKKYSDDLRRLRDQRGQIQGALNYQGAKTDASANNILMFSPMQKVLGWADLDHLVPQDTSHPDYLEYLQGLGLTPQQYSDLEAINDRHKFTGFANSMLMASVGGAGLKLTARAAPAAIQILTNHLISKGVPAAKAHIYATSAVLMGTGYGGQQIARGYTNQLARWQREHGHTSRGYLQLALAGLNIVPYMNTTSAQNVLDTYGWHEYNAARAYRGLAYNGKAPQYPVMYIPWVERDTLKQAAVGGWGSLFSTPGTPLPNWAVWLDRLGNIGQMGAPVVGNDDVALGARLFDPSSIVTAAFDHRGTVLESQINQLLSTPQVHNHGDVIFPGVPMVKQITENLHRNSNLAANFATAIVQTNATGLRWPALDGAKALLKSANPKDKQLAREQLNSALFELMKSGEAKNDNAMSYIQLTNNPGATSMRKYYQRQLTQYVQSASPEQLADVIEDWVLQDFDVRGELPDQAVTQSWVVQLYKQGTLTKQTADQLLMLLSGRGLVSLDAGGFGVQGNTPPPGAPAIPFPGVRFELEGL